MLLSRKRLADKAEQDRQRAVNYKRFFGSPEGRDVLFDLMNRYHILNPSPGKDAHELAVAEGQRRVVLYILSQANVDLVQLDKILKGEFNQ